MPSESQVIVFVIVFLMFGLASSTVSVLLGIQILWPDFAPFVLPNWPSSTLLISSGFGLCTGLGAITLALTMIIRYRQRRTPFMTL
jgi:hypothetical protein